MLRISVRLCESSLLLFYVTYYHFLDEYILHIYLFICVLFKSLVLTNRYAFQPENLESKRRDGVR